MKEHLRHCCLHEWKVAFKCYPGSKRVRDTVELSGRESSGLGVQDEGWKPSITVKNILTGIQVSLCWTPLQRHTEPAFREDVWICMIYEFLGRLSNISES
jgi:hypothetical protein